MRECDIITNICSPKLSCVHQRVFKDRAIYVCTSFKNFRRTSNKDIFATYVLRVAQYPRLRAITLLGSAASQFWWTDPTKQDLYFHLRASLNENLLFTCGNTTATHRCSLCAEPTALLYCVASYTVLILYYQGLQLPTGAKITISKKMHSQCS